ncbi:MAG: haloacid dehalogenase-like hydrolase [Bacteroidetes bacterium ADurb.Bin234]|nr:MAG: haloacid dehalogenase-like hydrolase [Bacteroidetes bacterium ADurb.Bin234]
MEKKNKEIKKIILAICYDFDKTLSPDDMQAQGYIQSVGDAVKDFWTESNGLAQDNEMDQNLAYMYLMLKKSRGKNLFTRETLKTAGSKVTLFNGVDTWFDRINQYGIEHNILIEHYIISSGLKEMIEGTSVANKFKKIYASSFYFDDTGVAVWPAQVVNYTNKTQFLFRIKKGFLDVNDQQVNTYIEPSKFRVPFRNMVYIGDSDTDIPCMKLVNTNGGYSIGVYNSETKDKSKVFKMLNENRIKYFVPSDYSENSELDNLLKHIIDRTQTNEVLENKYYNCIEEKEQEIHQKSEEEREKDDLINQLESSSSFMNTHKIIKLLESRNNWSKMQKDKLMNIALTNNQVRYILTDDDVKAFFTIIIDKDNCKIAKEIRKEIS